MTRVEFEYMPSERVGATGPFEDVFLVILDRVVAWEARWNSRSRS